MGQFFKTVLASCLGIVLAGLVLFVFMAGYAGSMLSKGSAKPKVKPNSILELTFSDALPEKTNNVPVNPYEFDQDDVVGVQDMLRAIETAKEDDNIKGIFINVLMTNGGQVQKALVREALLDFKKSGKFVVAYAKYYTQGAYYLASVADEIYLNPVGMMEFKGYSAQLSFYKNMLDKLGVKMQVFYAGKFKGASEPYRRTDLSAENRLQIREYINDLYNAFLTDVSETRGVSVAESINY